MVYIQSLRGGDYPIIIGIQTILTPIIQDIAIIRMEKQPSEPKKYYIYILALEHHCFYVGRTNNLPKRLQDHKKGQGKGAQWTRMHKPIKLLALIDCIFREEEDMWTKKLMGHYSIHQVRGGAYSQVSLGFDQLFFLERELRNSKDECFICGAGIHFAQKCPNKPETQGQKRHFVEKFIQKHTKPKQNFGSQNSTQAESKAEWKEFIDNHLEGLPYFSNEFGCDTYNYNEGTSQQRQGFSKEYLQKPDKGEQLSLYVGAANSAFLLALAQALFLRPELRLVAKRTLLEVQRQLNPKNNEIEHQLQGHRQGQSHQQQRFSNAGAEDTRKRPRMTQDQEYEELKLFRSMSEAKKKIKTQTESLDNGAINQAKSSQYTILSPLKNLWNTIKRLF